MYDQVHTDTGSVAAVQVDSINLRVESANGFTA
jgi:hypothetical protein